MESVVHAVTGQQVRVTAGLDNASLIEHADAISVLDGGQSMGDHDARAAFLSLVQGLLYHLKNKMEKSNHRSHKGQQYLIKVHTQLFCFLLMYTVQIYL